MIQFKVGDRVRGVRWSAGFSFNYEAIVVRVYGSDFYGVNLDDGGNACLDLKNFDTMEYATKLHKLLAGVENV